MKFINLYSTVYCILYTTKYCLRTSFGITGSVFSWLQSYLSNRTQSLRISHHSSTPTPYVHPWSSPCKLLLNYCTFTRSLRFANTNLLSVPRVRTTIAFQVPRFQCCSPRSQELPFGINDSSSTHTFRRLLKTHYTLCPCFTFFLAIPASFY